MCTSHGFSKIILIHSYQGAVGRSEDADLFESTENDNKEYHSIDSNDINKSTIGAATDTSSLYSVRIGNPPPLQQNYCFLAANDCNILFCRYTRRRDLLLLR